MIKDAKFSECGKYRYWLSRIWDESLPMVTVIGLNPSKATEEKDDATIRNLVGMLTKAGYGGFFMCNLFGWISTDPDQLRQVPNPVGENDYYLHECYKKSRDVIFAWGAFPQGEYRAKQMIHVFPDALCFGKSKLGKPMHPLAASVWMKDQSMLQKFKP